MIVYAFRQVKVHERNYPTYDLEFAVVVFALMIGRHYLYGVNCEIYMDRHSLNHLMTQKGFNLVA